MTNPDIEMMTLDNSDADDDKKNDETVNHEQNDNQINIIFNPSYQPPDNHLSKIITPLVILALSSLLGDLLG